MSVQQIFKLAQSDGITAKHLLVQGWLTTNRHNKNIAFLGLQDGSTFNALQVVVHKNTPGFLTACELKQGSAFAATGTIHLTPKALQPLELRATEVKLLSATTSGFPLQKNRFSLPVLRELPHLRHRTQFFRAVFRVRSLVFSALHKFFDDHGFTYVTPPVITSNDGEGTGETFVVNTPNPPAVFDRTTVLGVTGQLHLEAMALGFNKVYALAPTFRAEHSHTKRHAAEFWMLEPEMAFATLTQVIELAFAMVVNVTKEVLRKATFELGFLDAYHKQENTTVLRQLVAKPLVTITYKKAVKILQDHHQNLTKDTKNKLVPPPSFGEALRPEHERYLADKHFQAIVAVTNYPKGVKAFYMQQNSDQQTVAAFDLLVPQVGELVGGSCREASVSRLVKAMQERNINPKDFAWYVDIRNQGYFASAGFGLGVARFIMFLTGVANIRDVIPFPRVPGRILG